VKTTLRTVEEGTITVLAIETSSRVETNIRVETNSRVNPNNLETAIATTDKQQTVSRITNNPLIDRKEAVLPVEVHEDVVTSVVKIGNNQIILITNKPTLTKKHRSLARKINKRFLMQLIKKNHNRVGPGHP